MEQGIRIHLSRPDITEKEIASVISVLRSPNLSLGPKVAEFEQKFADYVGSRFAIAVNSGTSGLHLAVRCLRIGEKDAVITTPFSFVASANCILYEKALPVFVDIDERTWNIDPEKIEDYLKGNCTREGPWGIPVDKRTGRYVRAILPVHIFGLPCDMERITDLAREYNLGVIEDACEAVGTEFNGRKAGTFGNLGVFAFYPNKQITTGEGGLIVTDDENFASLCRSLRNQGRGEDGRWLDHHLLGYNYRISDINCALGIAQLERIDEILEKRDRVACRYNELLKGVVLVPEVSGDVRRSWFVYVVCLPKKHPQEVRDKILAELNGRGIGCKNYFPPIHLQPYYRERFGFKEGDFEVTEAISKRTIALPFHNHLKEEEIVNVAETLKGILERWSERA